MTDDRQPDDQASEPAMCLEERFALRRPLGEGGFGVVFETWDANLRRTVAPKTLREETTTLEARRGLAAEARVTAALDHPGVVPVYDTTRGQNLR